MARVAIVPPTGEKGKKRKSNWALLERPNSKGSIASACELKRKQKTSDEAPPFEGAL